MSVPRIGSSPILASKITEGSRGSAYATARQESVEPYSQWQATTHNGRTPPLLIIEDLRDRPPQDSDRLRRIRMTDGYPLTIRLARRSASAGKYPRNYSANPSSHANEGYLPF